MCFSFVHVLSTQFASSNALAIYFYFLFLGESLRIFRIAAFGAASADFFPLP